MSDPLHEVIIIGSGFAGLGMGIALKRRGQHDFVILEKADDLGGTWRDNHYPGCACDIPSQLYSFSFELNPGWTRTFAPQAEILAYLRGCADKYGLRPHLRFGAAVLEARFDEVGACWEVRTAGGAVHRGRFLVLGVGALSRPAYPDLPGLPRFTGKAFHSAAWDHHYPLAGRRVGVIGTGASAVQFLPQVAAQAARVVLFQRTPPWILPRKDRAVPAWARRLYARAPLLQRLVRGALYAQHELRGLGFIRYLAVMRGAAHLGRRHLRAQVPDPALRQALTPAYLPGCKRILMANDYYPTLCRDNVHLETDPIAEVTADAVVTRAGHRHAVDALIFGTGFRVTDLLTPLQVRGRGGADLNQRWQEGMEAYLGTTLAGFPNLFMLVGPNTGLGHNSMVFMIEAQIHYALRCMDAVQARRARLIEVRAGAQRDFNAALQPRFQGTVWSTGCQSWYLDRRGRNPTLWPGLTLEYWLRTRRPIREHYAFD